MNLLPQFARSIASAGPVWQVTPPQKIYHTLVPRKFLEPLLSSISLKIPFLLNLH